MNGRILQQSGPLQKKQKIQKQIATYQTSYISAVELEKEILGTKTG